MVRPDEGILVRDLNGNGVIDSGRELFGDQTELPPGFGNVLGTGLGGPQLATNGWQALAALDSNRDGIINASDAALTGLEVWRDLNQGAVRYPNSSRDRTARTKNLGSSTSTKPAETKTCKRKQSALKLIAAYACF